MPGPAEQALLEKLKTRPPKESMTDRARNWTAAGVRGGAALLGSEGFWPGAVINAGGELAAETIEPRDKYSWPTIGAAGAVGAVPFGAPASVGAAALRGGMFGGGGALAYQQAQQGLHIPSKTDLKNVGESAAIGAVTAGAGKAYFGRGGAKAVEGEVAPVAEPPKSSKTVEPTHVGASPDQVLPQDRDVLRRATLDEYRAYRNNPDTFTPKRAQALADNLVKRVGSPNAHKLAQDIYSTINDPQYVADVVRPGMGHGATLSAEGESPMSTSLKAQLGTETPGREPGLIGQEGEKLRGTGLETVDELGSRGKGFAPESPIVQPEGQPKMFAKRTKGAGRQGKVKPNKVVVPSGEAPVKGTPKATLAPEDVEDLPGSTQPQNISVLPDVEPAPADRPFYKTDDNSLAFLAKSGNVNAQKELALRKGSQGPSASIPSESGPVAEEKSTLAPLAERIKGEAGSAQIFPTSTPKPPKVQKPLEEGETVPMSGGWFGTLREAENHSPGFADKFRSWVDARKATKVEGMLKKKEFTSLDSKGIQGIYDFQDGVRDGKFKDVQDYFDTKHQQVEQSGIRLGFKENYLPQLWNNTPEEVFSAARRLGLRPQFSLPSILENYRKGIEVGLKPKFQNISDLVGWYEGTANKAIADRQFFDHMVDKNLIRPKGKAPANGTWQSLDPDHFPIQKFKTGTKEFQGVLMAPKPVADTINNYLRPAQGKVLDTAANAMSVSKNYVMSSGIPGTGINAHGFNILARNIMANGAKGATDMLKYMVSPASAQKELDAALPSAPFAMRHGLNMSVEDFQIGEANLKGALQQLGLKGKMADNKLLDFHTKYFEKPLFQQIIPALKLKHFNDFYGELRKQGLSEIAAGRSAAEATNNLYGGINWEGMGRSRDYQNLLRTVFLAPDWFETNMRIGKGMVQALKNPNTPQGMIYSKVAKNLVATYVAANVINMGTAGHAMWDNAPGHTLDIQVGKSGDKNRYIRTFGTAADFARLPVETLSAALHGDLGQGFKIVKNRLSMPMGAGANLITNTDDFGNKITGKDVYGKPIPVAKQALGVANEVTSPMIPQYIRNPAMMATGRLNAEQAIAGTTESPLRYAYDPQGPGRTRRRLRTRVR